MQQTFARVPIGVRRHCCLCGKTIGRFLPYRGGWAGAPPLMRVLRMVGSDLDRYLCPACGCTDRERHLTLYFSRLGLFERIRGREVLHFAPEHHFGPLIERAKPSRYVQADLYPNKVTVERVDMLAMPYGAGTFDFVIANHVLEHVGDDVKALSELNRILRPGGYALLQTPFSDVLENTISDPGIISAEARLQLYGQEDHARLYGRDLCIRIRQAGFISRVVRHKDLSPDVDPDYHGVNREEPLLLFQRT